MGANELRDVFVDLTGQDDNLGDSALRSAYLHALLGEGRRLHVFLGDASRDYIAGLMLTGAEAVYTDRNAWLQTSESKPHAVHAFNAGEIDPKGGVLPNLRRAVELHHGVATGGRLIVAGLGIKNLSTAESINFAKVFKEASVCSWRDQGSHQMAGFGAVAPDWGYSLGSPTSDWAPEDSRPLVAVTLRSDRPWPDATWLHHVRSFAARHSLHIVTLAQVARDAPRAVYLAQALGGEYRCPPSMAHDALSRYARNIFQQSSAVISDRAHGLIIGSSEGAYPIGSAADPQKIRRILAVADLDHATGSYDEFGQCAAIFESHRTGLAQSIDAARASIVTLKQKIDQTIDSLD